MLISDFAAFEGGYNYAYKIPRICKARIGLYLGPGAVAVPCPLAVFDGQCRPQRYLDL